MRMMVGVVLAGLLATAAGAATVQRREAPLRDATGANKGLVSLAEAAGSTIVTVAARGLPRGAKGLHVHAIGRCDAPGFTTAGEHFNPARRQHGRDNPAGAHLGDLPNIDIGDNGAGSVTFELPVKLRQLLDRDGAAVIIHASADDYRTDPSGNSGARVACAAFRRR